jgi:carbon monoxide dehydrogenase subunit G
MTTIQQTTQINRPVATVYQFLANCNNHEQLMPSTITGWESTEDTARFAIQGLAKLSLQVENRIENQKIVFVPSEKAPFDVNLIWELTSIDDSTTQATMRVDAELNMMLKMMVSGPLQKLVDHQVQQLAVLLK